jgi:hypothetical protein
MFERSAGSVISRNEMEGRPAAYLPFQEPERPSPFTDALDGPRGAADDSDVRPPGLDAVSRDPLHVLNVIGDENRVQRRGVGGDRDVEILEANASLNRGVPVTRI